MCGLHTTVSPVSLIFKSKLATHFKTKYLSSLLNFDLTLTVVSFTQAICSVLSSEFRLLICMLQMGPSFRMLDCSQHELFDCNGFR